MVEVSRLRCTRAVHHSLAVVVVLAVLRTVAPPPASAQDFAVVAHPGVGVDAISRAELADLFLKKKTAWASGQAAVPVDQGATAPLRAAFARSVLGRSTAQVESYWRQRVFAGEAVPPLEKDSDAAVVAFVRATPGAVGYVAAGAATTGVKVLRLEVAAPAPAPGGATAGAAAAIAPPRTVKTSPPEYPRVAERAGVACDLKVVVRVDERGVAEPLRAAPSCAYFQKDFERAAFAAVRRWKFEPARDRAGNAVAVEHEITIHFQF